MRRKSANLAARLDAIGTTKLALLPEAFLTLAVASVAIRWLPFVRVGAMAARPLGHEARTRERNSVADIAWAVAAWARRVPWRAVCFQQGLAVQMMLRRRGVDSTLYFGAANKPGQGLEAHVWVKIAETAVIGCEEARGFAVLAQFPRVRSRQAASGPAFEEPKRFDQLHA